MGRYGMPPPPKGVYAGGAARKYTSQTDRYKKPHRYRPGTVALQEIRREQKLVDLIFPKAPFRRLVREIVQDFQTSQSDGPGDLRVAEKACQALQVAAEAELIETFSLAQKTAIDAGRETIMQKDMQLVKAIQENKTSTTNATGLQ